MLPEEDLKESIDEVDFLLTVGCDIQEIPKAVKLAEIYDKVYASVGFHPYEADFITEADLLSLSSYIDRNSKIVAVGEAGLDFYRNTASPKNQLHYFIYQIHISKIHNLPIIIHSREANRQTAEIIKSEKVEKGVMHCFGGDYNLLKTALDSGLYISFAGNITYPKADNLREMLRLVPPDRLLLETDSPYLSPQSVRGQRNKPSHVKYTYQFVSEFLSIDIEMLSETVYNNTMNLFNIRKEEMV